jgi:AcrR family transcriptional regulator
MTQSTVSASARPASGRALETRARLLGAGRTAFADKGLAGTNLKTDILDPAGVSVGSFYHQFPDKTELLLSILFDHSEKFRERLREIHRPRPGRSLERLVRDSYELVFADAEANADILRIQLRERHSGSKRVREFLREDRERWISSLSENFALIEEAAGLPPAAHGAAELIVSLAHGAVAHLLEIPTASRARARARLVDNLVRFSLGGMSALLEHENTDASRSRIPSQSRGRAG